MGPLSQPLRQRKQIRLRGYDYDQPGAYFLTICTQNRECLFGDVANGMMQLNDTGLMVQETWRQLPSHYPHIVLDEFIVMPNHLHGILVITAPPPNVGAVHEPSPSDDTDTDIGAIRESPLQRRAILPKAVGRFKMVTAKQINQYRQTPGWPVWQRNYYEHIVRTENDLNPIRNYIISNPAQWAQDTENPHYHPTPSQT